MLRDIYEGNSISKIQIVIEKNRMEIMTYKQHLYLMEICNHVEECPVVFKVQGQEGRNM
jgi:hypothetical protein